MVLLVDEGNALPSQALFLACLDDLGDGAADDLLFPDEVSVNEVDVLVAFEVFVFFLVDLIILSRSGAVAAISLAPVAEACVTLVVIERVEVGTFLAVPRRVA